MRTVKEWRTRLRSGYAEALEDVAESIPLSPREVLDIVVRYKGGIASGFEVVCLVNEIWGGQLPEEPVWQQEVAQ